MPPLSAHTNWMAPLTRPSAPTEHPAPSPAASPGAREAQDEPQWSEPRREQENQASEENLGAYSAEGSYTRRALQFQLDAAEPPAAEELLSPGGSGEPSGPETTAQKIPRASSRRGASSRIGTRRSRPKQQSGRRLSARSTINLQELQQQQQRRPIDPSAVYRDQVYRFDGHSSAVQVPRAVLANALASRTSTANKTGDGHLFGRRHTLSFWMRHAPPHHHNHHHHHNPDPMRPQRPANGSSPDEPGEMRSHAREHLLCATLDDWAVPADGAGGGQHGHSKHHYAVFVRNCRLNLLMRRHASANQEPPESKEYLPAEWRWSLPADEACDNKWHLYTINVNFPSVELYIDGSQFEESYDNLVIVDDLPLQLRKSAAVSAPLRASSVQYEEEPAAEPEPESVATDGLSVGLGACWDALHRTWSGHFRGQLSGLTVLANGNDDSRAIECLGACSEELVSTAGSRGQWAMRDQAEAAGAEPAAPPMDDGPAPKMDNSLVAYQESQSRILLQGHDFLDVEEALTQIAYVNHRQLPSVGKRNILLETQIDCSTPSTTFNAQHSDPQQQLASPPPSGGGSIPIAPVRIEVNVLPSKSLPVIAISGTPNLAHDYGPFIQGIQVFASVSVRSKRLNLQQFMRHSQSVVAHEPTTMAARTGNNQSRVGPDDADYIDDDSVNEENGGAGSEPKSSEQSSSSSLAGNRRRIESCGVQVYPPLNALHESLLPPLDQIDTLQLYWRHSHEGFIIYGVDSAETYERLIRATIYRNQKPAYYLERVFKLLCTDLNGRLLSNEYLQTVTIIHDSSSSSSSSLTTDNSVHPKSYTPKNLVELATPHTRLQEAPEVHRPSFLRSSPLELNFEGSDAVKLNHAIQPLTPLNLEQSTRLDRIAMAFLVFVVSLIVMMLVIALTNLKEPSIKSDPSVRKNRRRRFKGKSSCELDLQEHRADRMYPMDEMASDEDEVDDEEEEYDDDDYIEEPMSDGGQHHSRATYHIRPRPEGTSSTWKGRGLCSSTDQESLAWDEEGLLDVDENQSTVRLVMNPILHGDDEDEVDTVHLTTGHKSMITEQRPDWRGAMSRKPVSHLISCNSSASSHAANVGEQYDEEDDEEDDDEFEESSMVETNERQLQRHPRALAMDTELLSCCSSSTSASSSCSSSASSSTSSSTANSSASSAANSEAEEEEDDNRNNNNLNQHMVASREHCKHSRHHHHHHHHHRRHHHHHHHHHPQHSDYLPAHHHHRQVYERQRSDSNQDWIDRPMGQHYELYHKHHLHHRCLKQRHISSSKDRSGQEQHHFVPPPDDFGVQHLDLADLELGGSQAAGIDESSVSDSKWSPASDMTAALTCADTSSSSSTLADQPQDQHLVRRQRKWRQ